MSGEELKIKILKTGSSLKEIAAKLGMSQQNLNASLKVADVKTGLVERICGVLDMSIFDFYGGDAKSMYIQSNNNKSFNNQDANNFLHEIAEQRKLTEKAQNQIDRLLSIIEKSQNS